MKSLKLQEMSGWAHVCTSENVPCEAARAVSYGDRRLVVWRDGEGGIHVWDDACPHRGNELSTGRVTGGLITCASHGWRFDSNGQHVRPLTVASSCRDDSYARTYEAREHDGTILAML
ncbi:MULTISPECIES: Rieske 2Fe-2S domain-containing protein [unclassified Caballeronia]|uniref:Rieske 2Fe-2S domain-containing protein n=1 Tax=unclassified Caballeronia TaxID=2646786 RepID=UPI0020287326|nr:MULTISPECIES: Rieske 2Fe-2S domain-containing protein [unclassified Caballeronia]MDR5776207.1 Rieske 2Fe-2S domain-containing protein [Caballeronia sp. LZ002]MDR5801122.1 Rieske 2Fe-2S domain-containing protein [Caballeronia sp. LZ001]MDR5851647.1 Rieske 2Fe-2S domain-containing protein [Caballeronia sp. LZ003]